MTDEELIKLTESVLRTARNDAVTLIEELSSRLAAAEQTRNFFKASENIWVDGSSGYTT